jgi:hypothetical protein
MTSPVITENFYTAAFLVREANGFLSRDAGVIANGTGSDVQMQGGLVLSAAAPATPATAAALGTNTGNGTFGTIAVANPAVAGAYTVEFDDATHFVVSNPAGQEIGHGTTGVAFSAGGLGFTITAGGTPFAAGDSFKVTVTAGTGFVPYTGAAPAVAILYNHSWIPANGSKKVTIITRMAEVNASELQWDSSVTGSGSVAALEATALAQLAALGIVAR